jgi:hypothetical protein
MQLTECCTLKFNSVLFVSWNGFWETCVRFNYEDLCCKFCLQHSLRDLTESFFSILRENRRTPSSPTKCFVMTVERHRHSSVLNTSSIISVSLCVFLLYRTSMPLSCVEVNLISYLYFAAFSCGPTYCTAPNNLDLEVSFSWWNQNSSPYATITWVVRLWS